MTDIKFYDGVVTTEGDDIYYKVRGDGKPILFIAPAGGNGDGYYGVSKTLSEKYKIITYDRRANTRSTMNFPDQFDIRQQSRDACAVLKAVGEDRAIVVGNSSGAVIALDLAAAYPESVHAAIIHEAAIPSVLPNEEVEKWGKFFQSCYDVGKEKGSSKGAMRFYFGVELPAIRLMWDTLKVTKYEKQDATSFSLKRIPSKLATDYLVFNELLTVTRFMPDFEAIKNSNVKIFICCGQYGIKKNAWYYRAARISADSLGCEFIAFPGHHGEYMGRYLPWTKVLEETIHKSGW
jgi:pimeloyl-ACP methyl ester carboxylesterase